jgi:hypothetical protein
MPPNNLTAEEKQHITRRSLKRQLLLAAWREEWAVVKWAACELLATDASTSAKQLLVTGSCGS